MSKVRCVDLLQLFCCPPCPAQITSKLAYLPPLPSYTFYPLDENESDVYRRYRVEFHYDQYQRDSHIDCCHDNHVCCHDNYSQAEKSDNVSKCDTTGITTPACTPVRLSMPLPTSSEQPVTNAEPASDQLASANDLKTDQLHDSGNGPRCLPYMVRTRRGNTIACLYAQCSRVRPARFTLLFAHGNAVDIGLMFSFYEELGAMLSCDVVCFDYSGYGRSSGRPSERNMYADIEAVWLSMQKQWGLTPERVVVYGQSIGTAAAVHLASVSASQCSAAHTDGTKHAQPHVFAGVVLHSPLLSGMRVACRSNRTWLFDPFASIDKVGAIRSLVLVIHGTEDEVIDMSHGTTLHSLCPNTVDPLWVEGAGHNDIDRYEVYLRRLEKFITHDLAAK